MPTLYPTKDVFRFFKTILEDAYVHDPLDYVDPMDPEVINWPVLGLDWVKRFEGPASAAVKQGLESLQQGHYRKGVIIAMSSISPDEIDSAGVEFALDTPVTLILLMRHPGTTEQEELAEELDDMQDAIYLTLDPYVYDPAVELAQKSFYQFNLLNIFALQGAADWKGRRFVYMARRSVIRT